VKTRFACCLVALGGVLASLPALAQPIETQPVSPWYIGFGGMRNDATIPGESVNAVQTAVTPPGTALVEQTVDDRFSGWKLYIGYEFTPNIALEVGGSSMGTTTVAYDFLDATFASLGSLTMRYNVSAVFADAVGSFPIGHRWKVFGRVGASVGRTRVQLDSPSFSVTVLGEDTETGTDIHLGAGAQYDFNPSVALRLEYERWNLPDPLSSDEVKVDTLGASLQVRF
jgi:OOP family OmpA-OmpF porin